MPDLGMEAMQVEFKATKVTLETLMNIFNKIVEGHYTPSHGEQSLQKLHLQNAELTTLDVDPVITHDLRKHLKKLGVDFHIDKRAGTIDADGQQHYVLWIKARDQKCIKQALERTVQHKTVEAISHDAEIRSKQKSSEQERQHHDPNRGDDPR